MSFNKKGKTTTTASSNGAACLCPIATAGALMTPRASSARQALEQELLSRADLLQQQGGVAGDQRRERRMRNRASAERSRARRHAYVNELETEVRALRQENEHLKRLCGELKEEAAEDHRAPVNKTTSTTTPRLQRTSSSPF